MQHPSHVLHTVVDFCHGLLANKLANELHVGLIIGLKIQSQFSQGVVDAMAPHKLHIDSPGLLGRPLGCERMWEMGAAAARTASNLRG